MIKLTKYSFAVLMCVSINVNAGNLMKELFEDNLRINASSGGNASTSSTYGYAFGGASVRIRHLNANVVTFTPPSLTSGCSGIDFFAGSFSMVNKDEIVQMGRAVLQGAGSYAFGLALDSICPSCNEEMKTWLEQLRKVNEKFKDTCAISEALVDNSFVGDWAAKNKQANEGKVPLAMTKIGDSVDFFASKLGAADDPAGINSNQEIKELISSNYLTDALKKYDTNWMAAYGLDSDDAKGFVIALMGSNIHKLTGDDDGTSASGLKEALPPLFGVKEFVFGKNDNSNLKIYKCKAFDSFPKEACLDVEKKDTGMKSMLSYYEEKIIGTAGLNYQDGVAKKFFNYQKSSANAQPSVEEYAFLKSFDMDLLEMFELIGHDDTMLINVGRWSARSQAIKVSFALISELKKEFMNLTKNDYSDRPGLLADIKESVPQRIDELTKEVMELNEVEQANKASITLALQQFKELKMKIISRNAKSLAGAN